MKDRESSVIACTTPAENTPGRKLADITRVRTYTGMIPGICAQFILHFVRTGTYIQIVIVYQRPGSALWVGDAEPYARQKWRQGKPVAKRESEDTRHQCDG